MTHLVIFEQQYPNPVHRGVVEVDIDPAAERYAVFDRKSMNIIRTGFKPSSNIVRFIVPFQYTVGFDLFALIFDDLGEPSYNLAGADKIQAELVDARTVVLNP